MNANQIQVLQGSYNKQVDRPDGNKGTTGEYMRFITDCNLEFVTSKDMVVTDDDNGMLHCVCLNEDVYTQASFPVKIISAPYEDIHAVEAVMSRENFEKFINEGFLSGISKQKKEFMIKWFRDIDMQKQQPNKATPYYTQKPAVTNMTDSTIARDDGITKISAPASMNHNDHIDEPVEEEAIIDSDIENGMVDVDGGNIVSNLENDVMRVSDPGNNVSAQVADDVLKVE